VTAGCPRRLLTSLMMRTRCPMMKGSAWMISSGTMTGGGGGSGWRACCTTARASTRAWHRRSLVPSICCITRVSCALVRSSCSRIRVSLRHKDFSWMMSTNNSSSIYDDEKRRWSGEEARERETRMCVARVLCGIE